MTVGLNRLVYSPKAYAFVRTDGTAKNDTPFLDISDYIVRGNVTRVTGAASTATLTLRNPNKKWVQPGAPTFHPMDPITIYLSRYKPYPVQVFTGYLDKTPYLNLFPGTVTLQASCTLKKLLHTYWDPALPFTIAFMNKYGWTQDPTSGQMQNLGAVADGLGSAPLTDGSIGQLLHAVLTEKRLGNYADNEVFIEQLPSDIITVMKKLYKAFKEEETEVEAALTSLFSQVVGGGSYGSGGTGATTTASGTGNITSIDKIIPGLVAAADKHNIDSLFVITTWLAEGAVTDISPNSSGARGYFQFTSATPYWFYTNKPINYPKDASDLGIAADLFCGAAALKLKQNPSFGNRSNWEAWAETTQQPGMGAYASYWSAKLATAQSYLTTYGTNDSASPKTELGRFPVVATTSSVSNESDKAGKDLSTANGSGTQSTSATGVGAPRSTAATTTPKIYAPIAGTVTYLRGWHESSTGVTGETTTSGHLHWHSGIDAAVPAGTPCIAPCDGEITMATATWSDGGMIHFKFTQDTGSIKAGTIIGWGHIESPLINLGPVKGGTIIARSGSPGGGPHVHFVLITSGTDGTGDGDADPSPILHALQEGSTVSTGVIGNTGAATSATSSGGSVLDNSTAAAFAVGLSWPSLEETAEAQGLTGQKSLMNDQQLMPFIQQLTSASLRQFQSLPNGDFFAFFPDYFGDLNHRKPYWFIEDIEIIDGKIELTDDALATHVYTVGDTAGQLFTGGVDFVDKLLSGGVMTIFNAFESEFVLGADKTKLMAKNADAIKFLQKYGARPYYEEIPMVRSPYYEAFYAFQTFQLLWSRTFLTEFQLTFMPELYPGGIVAFRDHGLQCYIDSVSHDFDYEAGFTTTAQLSAPAAYGPGDDLGLSAGLVRANAT